MSTQLQVVLVEQKYPRKPTEYSAWVVSSSAPLPQVIDYMDYHTNLSIKKLFCISPLTPYREIVDLRVEAFRVFLEHGGEASILKYVTEQAA